jgi:transcriptional regulator with XRE-family HTH domain
MGACVSEAESEAHVGARIREARQALGLSQVELAERVRVSQPTIAHWEQGTHTPRQLALARLADALGVSRTWLMTGPAEPIARSQELQKTIDGRTYLTRPMRHTPMYGWPDSVATALDCLSGSAQPFDYLPISWDISAPIGFIVEGHDAPEGFERGALAVLDGSDRTLRDGGVFLVALGDRILLRRWSAAGQELVGRYETITVTGGTLSALGRARLSIRRW